jgi:hypothetical protein
MALILTESLAVLLDENASRLLDEAGAPDAASLVLESPFYVLLESGGHVLTEAAVATHHKRRLRWYPGLNRMYRPR